MRILKLNNKNKNEIFEEIIKVLNKRGLVVFPSDTVYGFLADATSNEAVKKLISFKNRPPGKPISIFVDSFEKLKDLVEIDKKQENVLREILPGPFTIILLSKGKVSYFLESEKKTLGVRLPNFSLIIELVRKFGKPITATSANISGKGPHWDIRSFLNTLSETKIKILDLIVDAGKLPYRKPSTVIDLTRDEISILRKGEIIFKNTRTYISYSAKQTREIGAYFASRYLEEAKKRGVVFIVEGELGVGKTQLAKGIGSYLGVEKEVISPSFVGFFEYRGKKVDCFYHFDLWGAREYREIEELRLEKLVGESRILFIEWGERMGEIRQKLKAAFLIYIKMKYISEKEREIKISEILK